jgi:hypothetical protein
VPDLATNLLYRSRVVLVGRGDMPKLRLLAAIALAAAILLSACGTGTGTTARATASATSGQATATPRATAAVTPVATAEPTPGTSTYAVGDVITITEDGEPWADFTVLEVQVAAEFIDPDGYFNDTPQTSGYVFVAANVRYTALTDGVSYGSFDFQVFVDGRAVEGFTFALNGPEPDLSSGTLPSGRVAEGWLLYEVPPTGEVLLSYSGNVFLNEAPIFEVVLRGA